MALTTVSGLMNGCELVITIMQKCFCIDDTVPNEMMGPLRRLGR